MVICICIFFLFLWIIALRYAVKSASNEEVHNSINEVRLLKCKKIVGLRRLFDERSISQKEFDVKVKKVIAATNKHSLEQIDLEV